MVRNAHLCNKGSLTRTLGLKSTRLSIHPSVLPLEPNHSITHCLISVTRRPGIKEAVCMSSWGVKLLLACLHTLLFDSELSARYIVPTGKGRMVRKVGYRGNLVDIVYQES